MSERPIDRALRGETLNNFPIVDVHVHADLWLVQHWPCPDDAMIAKMDRVGVDLICANGVIMPDVCEGNDRVAALAARHPGRVVPFAGLSPYSPRPMADELRRCFDELGFVGIKVHSMVAAHPYTPFSLMSDEAGWEAVWELASERKSVVLFHGVVTGDVIRRYPDIAFVQAHGSSAVESAAQFADCANYYCDTAATQNRASAIDDLAEAIGADHVLWGTDAPTVDFSQRLGVVLDSSLSDEDKKRILGGNALLLLQAAGYDLPRGLPRAGCPLSGGEPG